MEDRKKIGSFMKLAIQVAKETMKQNPGGPFGAVITNPEGKVIAATGNRVLEMHDPTAHAEMNAIRIASESLGTHDLSGCTLYATGYPCPMCLSAIIWANIKTVYFGCSPEDAEAYGFRGGFIYRYIRGEERDPGLLQMMELDREGCLELFQIYAENNKMLH